MSTCHESETEQAKEMQLDNIYKLDVKRSSRVKMGGNPTKQEMRRSVESVEEKAIYPKMIALLRERKSVESVVLRLVPTCEISTSTSITSDIRMLSASHFKT